MAEWVNVAPVAEFAPGNWRHVEVDEVRIAVFNLDGNYYAIEDVCTHDYGTLTGGAVEGETIVCPRHGARFHIQTGEALSAPAYEAVPTFPTRIQDGMVQVKDDRWD
jgi:3-phenylpropionate/trans-cinnamate dioxygenase ferredoxin subunit